MADDNACSEEMLDEDRIREEFPDLYWLLKGMAEEHQAAQHAAAQEPEYTGMSTVNRFTVGAAWFLVSVVALIVLASKVTA